MRNTGLPPKQSKRTVPKVTGNKQSSSLNNVGGFVLETKGSKIAPLTTTSLTTSDSRKIMANLTVIEDGMAQYSFEGTRFQYMNREQLKLYCSACTVTNGNDDGIGSVNDPRMGCTEPNVACATCHNTYADCQGHAGMIELTRPILNPDLIGRTKNLLESKCQFCNKFLLGENVKEFQEGGSDGIKFSSKSKAIGNNCDGTYTYSVDSNNGTVIEKIVRCGPPSVYKIGKKDKGSGNQYKIYKDNIEMNNEDIYESLKDISPEDKVALGCTRNTNFEAGVMWIIPVPPRNIRPDAFVKGIVKKDQMTEIYQQLAKLAAEQKELVGKSNQDKINEIQVKIQNIYAHLLNNSDKTLKIPRTENPFKDLRKRLAAKEELIRRHGMGKRSNFSARTVLNPNKRLKFGQISKPRRYASVLTVNTKLTRYNWNFMMKLYDAGKVVSMELNYSSAKGNRIYIRDDNRVEFRKRLGLGCTVHRWSIPGDTIGFNRHPSLYKYALMSYDEEHTDNEVIGMHSSTTTPHNADNDGDEGNLTQHQGPMVRAEGYYLSNVKYNTQSSHVDRPLMGLVFNCPAAYYILTLFPIIFDEYDWEEAISFLIGDDETKKRLGSLNTRLERYGVVERSGAALFSCLLPEDFNYNHGKEEKDDNGKIIKQPVEIREGILRSGVITKEHIGPVSHAIHHFMYKEYNPQFISRFFTEGQFIADWFIEKRGLSMCYSDCYPTDDVKKQIDEITTDGVKAAEKHIKTLAPETPQMTAAMRQHRENETILIMNNPANKGNKIAIEALPRDNNLSISCLSGSKGSTKNISQIMSLLGPQLVKGKIQERTMSSGRRSTPWHSFGDKSLGSIGFAASNFNNGLTPEEFFFHANSSRQGLVDTGSSTSKIGDMNHRLAKVLEGTVREEDNSIRSGTSLFQYVSDDNYKTEEMITVKTKIGNTVSFGDFGNIAAKLNARNGYDLVEGKYRRLKNRNKI